MFSLVAKKHRVFLWLLLQQLMSRWGATRLNSELRLGTPSVISYLGVKEGKSPHGQVVGSQGCKKRSKIGVGSTSCRYTKWSCVRKVQVSPQNLPLQSGERLVPPFSSTTSDVQLRTSSNNSLSCQSLSINCKGILGDWLGHSYTLAIPVSQDKSLPWMLLMILLSPMHVFPVKANSRWSQGLQNRPDSFFSSVFVLT